MPRHHSISVAILATVPAMTVSALAAPILLRFPDASASLAAGQRPAVAASPRWQLAVNRHFGQPGNASGFSVLLAAGRSVWVLGGTNPGGQSSPVAEIRAGNSWHAQPLPARLTDFISDASAPAANDIWAISGYGRYVLRWDGTRWHVAKRWREEGTLSGVTAVSATDAWVFGTSVTGARTIGTWHFDGRSWASVTGAGRDIYTASALSARDIWAISAGRNGDTIEHYGGRGWRAQRTGRLLRGIWWHDILAVSPGNVWMVGDTATKPGSGRIVLAHWSRGHWRRFDTTLRGWAGQLTALGNDRIVATATSSGVLAAGVIMQMTSKGRLTWSTISSGLGSGVSDVAFSPWTRALWASGGILTRLGGDAAVWTQPLQHGTPRPRLDLD